MKILFAALIALSAQASMAQCLGEAQIIAQVETAVQTSLGCSVTVSPYSIVQYNESGICPLDLAEVLEKGFNVNSCSYEQGQDISGVLVKNADGSITLE